MQPSRLPLFPAAALAAALLCACGESARQSVDDGTGPRPTLPPPVRSAVPTLNIAPADAWAEGEAPRAAADLRVTPFARGLDHPRWLLALPDGDVLVAETNAPPRPDEGGGLRGWIMGLVMKRAGSATPSANRITLLRDTNGDGVADVRKPLIEGLNSPFGMARVGTSLYVANTDGILRFPYGSGDTRIAGPGKPVAALPAGTLNHHWTKNLIASRDGKKLYATIGSNSNVAEHGMAVEADRAQIWEIDIESGTRRVFATGLRNPNGLAWVKDGATDGDVLWTVVNERDELGSDLVPDYLTSVRDGAFYGWPYSYYGPHVDARMQPPRPDLVARATVPDYALGPHTASLGLAASEGTALPSRFAHGVFIGQHGSWNRKPHSGYKVVFVPFREGRPAGPPLDVLTGFLSDDGKARGRPVGVAQDATGALLVADDVGNTVWRVTARP